MDETAVLAWCTAVKMLDRKTAKKNKRGTQVEILQFEMQVRSR